MSRILSVVFLCAGTCLSTSALAGNPCTIAGDSQLSFPGTSNPDVFAVMVDLNPSSGYGLSLCSPTALDISWLTAYTFGDFNHDGFEDLMFGRSSSGVGAVELFLNDKTGSGIVVLSATLPTGAGAAPTAVDALDLNGDGWDDIVTANGSDGTFSVLLNGGNGAFPAVKQYAAGSDVAILAAVDVNGDGYPDVITESTQDQTVSVFLNNGDGSFATPATYAVGGPVSSLSVADINGDGHPDIYVTSVAELDIFAPAPPPSTAGGTQKLLNNGDGTFTASAWQPYSSGSSGGSLSVSGGVDMTVTNTSLSQLLGGSGSQSSSVAVSSGGTITLPAASTPATVTTSGGKGQTSGSTGSTSNASGTTSGGGAMEWLSLMLLGLAGGLRRKRA